jgi:ABC-type transporter Mla subunit MlaD
MIPINLKTTFVASAATAVIVGVSVWWITADYKNARHQAIVSEMQIKANVALQEALVKTLEIERQNQQLAQNIELMSAKHKQELQNVENDLRNLVDNAGGLFDPNAANCPAGAQKPTSATKPINQTARGNISKDLERLLLSESRRADEAASYAMTCYNWLMELQK